MVDFTHSRCAPLKHALAALPQSYSGVLHSTCISKHYAAMICIILLTLIWLCSASGRASALYKPESQLPLSIYHKLSLLPHLWQHLRSFLQPSQTISKFYLSLETISPIGRKVPVNCHCNKLKTKEFSFVINAKVNFYTMIVQISCILCLQEQTENTKVMKMK